MQGYDEDIPRCQQCGEQRLTTNNEMLDGLCWQCTHPDVDMKDDGYNNARGEEAEDVLIAYYNNVECDDDLEQAATWLLCNMRHWADNHGINWSELTEAANRTYQDELA